MSQHEFERTYRTFEDRFRGSKEMVQARQSVYLPLIVTIDGARHALDIGCGRGEWLELLAANGWTGIGVDSNESMLEQATPAGITTILEDGLAYLQRCEDQSFDLVTAFHVVEHVSNDTLISLLKQIRRVLMPGGLVILETPNPENLTVSSWSFHMDPTHQAPIPPALLQYFVTSVDLASATVVRINGQFKDGATPRSRLAGLFIDGPDYSVIAEKAADGQRLRADEIARFAAATGEPSPADLPALARELALLMKQAGATEELAAAHTSLSGRMDLCAREIGKVHQELISARGPRETRMGLIDKRVGQVEQELLDAQDTLADRLDLSDRNLADIHQQQAALIEQNEQLRSEMMRLVALAEANEPDRFAVWMRRVGQGLRAWASLKPGTRPRRVARATIVKIHAWTDNRPAARRAAVGIASLVPRLDRRLRGIVDATYLASLDPSGPIPSKIDSIRELAPLVSASWPDDGLPYQESLARRRLFNAARYVGRDRETLPADKKRPRLAFVSPLPPERSGIADYSAVLIPALNARYLIDVVCDQKTVSDPWIQENCSIRNPAWFRENAHLFDRILYHFGNSTFHAFMFPLLADIPGTVVLHDFFLSSVLASLELEGGWGPYWTTALQHSHGYPAVATRWMPDGVLKAMDAYPANFGVLEQAQGIITHSRHARTLCADMYPAHSRSRWDVIPLVRSPLDLAGREAARRAVGAKPDDFIVCSFGFVQESKLSLRLAEAFRLSDLARDRTCRLVFVGAAAANEYGDEVLKLAADPASGGRISVTGYAAPDVYTNFLLAADLGVQLRSVSRGETSAAVLDCLAHGLPTIVNANGSMAELPPDCVLRLDDDFTTVELRDAITKLRRDTAGRLALGERAGRFVAEAHAPALVSDLYFGTIERFAATAPILHDHRKLISLAAERGISETRTGADDVAGGLREILSGYVPERPELQLLIDISAIVREDLRTGVQRVVRSQLNELMRDPPKGYRIEPVWLIEDEGTWRYRYARRHMLQQFGIPADILPDALVSVGPGDIFLGADLFPAGVIEAQRAGLYEGWRERGVTISFMVYDLLPLTMPHYFPPIAEEVHGRWAAAVAQAADVLVCISQSVADEVERWLDGRDVGRPVVKACALGADVQASYPSRGLPADAALTLVRIAEKDSFLMVGTIEPRKGHIQAIRAFETLWAEGSASQLVIVGGAGWKSVPRSDARNMPEILDWLTTHPERGHRLIWLETASDEYLDLVYRSSTCLIAASEGEGYGLPLIEAAQHGTPILARDIPVFREVLGDGGAYFSGDDATSLAHAIRLWLEEHRGRSGDPAKVHYRTWHQSVARLKDLLLDAASHAAHSPVRMRDGSRG